MFVINLNYLNKRVLEGNFLKVADFTDAAIHINTAGKQNREGIASKENQVLCQQYHLQCFYLAEQHSVLLHHASDFTPPTWPI